MHERTASASGASHPPAVSATIGRRVFQNTVAQIGGRGASLALSAATSILLARYLGHERMGAYGAIYAYLALYGFLATFCLEQILAREVSLRRQDAAQLFHTGTVAALGFSLLGAVLASLLAPLFGYTSALRWLIAVAALDLLIFPPLRLSGIVFQVDLRQWYAVAVGLTRQILWLAAIALLVMGHAAFYQVILARTLCGAIEVAIVLVLTHRRGFLEGPSRFSAEDARLMLRGAFPLVLSSIAVGIYHRIDQVMLHKMTGDRALGPYVIAVQLTEIFSALPVALMSSLFPVLVQTAGDEERFHYYLDTSYRLLLVVVFAACAVITPIALPGIQLLYGKEYLPAAALIIVLIWSEVPVFFGVAINGALIAKGLQRYLPASTVVGAVANIALNLLVIPRYGALGASWATVASYCLAGIFMFLIFGKTRMLVLQGLRIAWPPFLLALGITVGLHFLPWAFWWKLLLSCAVYAMGAALAGIIRKSEVDRLLSLVRHQKVSCRNSSASALGTDDL